MGCHTLSNVPVCGRIPGSRRGKAEYPGGGIPESVRILGEVTQFWQNILNLYFSTDSWNLFFYPKVTGILCQKEAVWAAAKSGDLWSKALHTATTTTTTNAYVFNVTGRHIGDKNWFQQALLWLSSSYHKLHLLPIHCCWQVLCFVCWDVGLCQLASGTMGTGLFTFLLWSGHCIQFALPANNDIHSHVRGQINTIWTMTHISMSYFEYYSNLAFTKSVEVNKWRGIIMFFQV